MKLLFPISIFLIVLIAVTSCSDETVVGSGLFENEELSLEHISETDLTARTVAEESVLTFVAGSSSRRTYFLGDLDNPYFGKTESQIYLTCGRDINPAPDFVGIPVDEVDSMVLALKLDTLGFYGDRDGTFNIKVYRMLEDISERDSIFSDEDFMIGDLLGEINDFKPAASATDTLKIVELDTVSVYPGIGQIRIPLSIDLAKEIFEDTTNVKNDTSFVENLLNGLYIVAESNGNSMIAVDLSPTAFNSKLSELAIYYSDTSKYGFGAGLVKTSRFTHDYSGSSVEEAIDGSYTFGDSLLFVESMSGTNLEFEFPDNLSQYNDRLLNFAELEITIATVPGYDREEYPNIQLMLPSSNNEDGELRVLEDFSVISTDFIPELVEVTDGGETLYRYRIPVTRYVRNIIEGTSIDNTLTLTTFLKSERPERNIIYGTEHSTFPSKLRLTFTK